MLDRTATIGALILGLTSIMFMSDGLWAQPGPQPFAKTDFNVVHSDALAVRYRVLKTEVYSNWCALGSTPSQICSTGVHRFCFQKKHATGFAYPNPTDSNYMDITCLNQDAAEVQTRTIDDLGGDLEDPNSSSTGTPNQDRIKRWCLNNDNAFNMSSPNHNCDLGIHTECVADGFEGGFGPVERALGSNGLVKYACLKGGVSHPEVVPYPSTNTGPEPDPTPISDHCTVNHGSEIIGDACHQAVADHCQFHGLIGGFGPSSSNSGSATFRCLQDTATWTANAEKPLSPSLPVDVTRRTLVAGQNGPVFSGPPRHNLLSASLAQSYDGRLIIVAAGEKRPPGQNVIPAQVNILVQVPEIFDAPLGQMPNGQQQSMGHSNTHILTDVHLLRGDTTYDELGSSMAVCDPAIAGPTPHHNQTQSLPSRTSNPQICDSQAQLDVNGGNDCYDLTLVTRHSQTGNPAVELWATPVRVLVENPKSSNPIVSMPTSHIGTPQKLGVPTTDIKEPVISGNGRLLVAQVNSFIQYSVIPPDKAPCDATGWTEFKHITEMYEDPLMADYGLAKFPLRDAENNVLSIAPGDPLRVTPGAYPWVDRDADNLIYIAGDQSLYYSDDDGTVHSRFPIVNHPITGQPYFPSSSDLNQDDFNGGRRIGLTITGLWTQGKMYTPDVRNNNLDINIPTNRPIAHRFVHLYEDVPEGTEFGGSEKTVLASPENQFNFLPNLLPEAPREVVWHLATWADTDEVVFDDVNHPRALIVSDMSASLNTGRVIGQSPSFHNRFNDGFEWTFTGPGFLGGRGYTQAPQVANNASAISQNLVDFAESIHGTSTHPLNGAVQWDVPPHGRLMGGARIEPLAAGGYQAKGLWLDGADDRVEYIIAPQPDPDDLADSPWFMTLAIDPRALPATQRLVTWPDGSFLNLNQGASQSLVLHRANGSTLLSANLVDPLIQVEMNEWSTIAVLSEPDCPGLCAGTPPRNVILFVNGYEVARTSTTGTAFNIQPGRMTVGAQSAGLKGWIDEFKVIGARPTFEEVCNHAGGTLVGVDSLSPIALVGLADAYPDSAHLQLRQEILDLGLTTGYMEFACELPDTLAAVDPNAPSVCVGKTHGAMNPECMRPLIHQLGIPLVWDTARPDTQANGFCLSCHVESNPSLTMKPSAALTGGTVQMHDDPRRQPLQTFPLLFGVIPVGYFDSPVPAPAADNNLDARTHP